MKRILGIGNALVDVLTFISEDSVLDSFSLPKGSMQLVDYEKSRLVKEKTGTYKQVLASGGSAANTIHGLSMLGNSPGFIGSIGEDDLGNLFENEMKTAGANTFLFRRTNATGTAVALVSPDSERTFATHLGAAVELSASDINPEYFRGFHILYMEGYLIFDLPLVEAASKLAKELGMEIAIDLASYNVVEHRHADFKYILEKYADIIFANEDEARAFTGEKPADALNSLAKICNTVIVKTGKDGSLIKRGEELIKVEALPVKCIDTTGAGDLYASGFLYGYSRGHSLDKCGAIGSLLAGTVIETPGARIPSEKWPGLKDQIMQIENS